MSRKREEVLEAIERRRVGAIVRAHDRRLAAEAMRAAIDGGFRLVEFTLNTPAALDLIAEFSRDGKVLVGAGTVMSPEQVQAAVEAGARFVVSPHTDPAVIAKTVELGALSIPGAYTPTEMVAATRAGADLVKLFPAPADIARYVRQIVGPLPHLRVFPTAGVTPDNFRDILEAGAFGVGFVSSLFAPRDMQTRNFSAIRRRAKGIVSALETGAS